MAPASADGDVAHVAWRRGDAGVVEPPLIRQLPSLEVKLEHPTLEPSGYGQRFYPDAVPYELGGTRRLFYWRPALSESSVRPDDWRAACATTHTLTGVDSLPWGGPVLTTRGAMGTTVVVAGTVGGDATTAHVDSYSPPAVSLDDVSTNAIELTVDGATHAVPAGERCRFSLDERRIECVGSDTGPTAVTPELAVRYPGRREIHHPAPGATYRLFPSFGLDLDRVPDPLPVPTTAGELDDEALATRLDVDLTKRPYPERVLWQAFAYTAFDPHVDCEPELVQLETGHVVVLSGRAEDGSRRPSRPEGR